MKKIVLLFALCLSFVAAAQDYPGKSPQLLVGKEVKILPVESQVKNGYKDFYSDYDLSIWYMANSRLYTKPEALVGKSFKVLAVEPFEFLGETSYKIKLENVEDGTVIYYRYSEMAEEMETYSFEVKGGLQFPAEHYKNYIEFETDKFTGSKTSTFDIPFLLTLTKAVKSKIATYILIIEAAPGDKPNTGKGKGAVLLLENGQRIDKPAQLVKVCDNHYCTTITLTMADINLLKANKVTDFRVNTYDETLTPLQAQRLQGALNYMVAN